MPLVSNTLSSLQEGRRHACGTRTGTRTAADFSIDLGFTPTHIRVVNLTSRAEALHIIDSNLDGGSNAKSLLTIAAGTRTYVAAGISLDADKRGFTVDVSVASLETDNSDVYWEAWC